MPTYNTLEESLNSPEKVQERVVVQETNEKKSEEHIIPEFSEVDAMKYDSEMLRLTKQLGITNEDMKMCGDKLRFLMDWAKKESGSDDILDALLVFKKTRDSLGFSELGKTAVNKFYQYARLLEDSRRVNKEIKLLKEKK